MLTPLRSVASLLVAPPPNRSELASSPVPVALGPAGGGVGRVVLGVCADDVDLDESFTSDALAFAGCCGFEAREFESISVAPSKFGAAAGAALGTEGEGLEAVLGCAKSALDFWFGVGEWPCEGTTGCCIVSCGECEGIEALMFAGGSIRLAIEGEADARLT